MRRFFVAPEMLEGNILTLEGATVQHMNVLRLRAGEDLLLLDGSGRACLCRLESLTKKSAVVHKVKSWCQPRGGVDIRLLQALPKGDKMEVVLQKGTELGITRFTPVQTERCQFNKSARSERWQRIALEAARQSRRWELPRIDPVTELKEAVSECTSPLRLLIWEDGASPLKAVLPTERPQSVDLLVGPEGGLSCEEAELARAKGFVPVHLGPRILRTETAAFTVAAILQFLYGDLDALPVTDRGEPAT